MTSSVTPVRSAIADILFYRNELRDWRKPDGTEVGSTSEAGRAIVHVVQSNQGYQIFAVRVRDEQMLLNQQLYENFHYKVATPVFHQWKNEQKQVIGLSFQNPDEAISFSRTVKEIVEALGGQQQQPLQQQYQQVNGNVSNGVYQDPQTLYQQNHRQQQQYANNNKDMDQESIGSGHSAAGMTNYRQQQKSSYSSLQNGHQSTLSQQQQQRRCSQGSSGSGSTPSSSNIYQATTPLTSSNNYGQTNGHHQNGSNGVPVVKAPVPPPPPPPQQLNGGNSSNNGTASNVAQVSKNAPPPPPPPPPGGLSLASGGSSLADQLKNATLRKSSAPVNRASSDVSQQQQQPQTPQPKTSVAGAQNLMSELAAKLGSRNTGVSTASSSIGISSTENGSTDSSGATMVGTTTAATKKSSAAEVPSTPSAPKPWSKPNGVAGITAANAGTLDSPKGQRKVINASNSVEGNNSSSSSITVADLEQFKQEILNEVNKTKEDISEIRQDISKLVKTQQEIFEALRAVLNQR